MSGDTGRRARVQGTNERRTSPNYRPWGSIAWWEHEKAWEVYHRRFPNDQTAEIIDRRGGFGYEELVMFLGYAPTTYVPGRSPAASLSLPDGPASEKRR